VVEFNLEQFEQAALSLEKAGNAADQYSFLVLAATYGHLRRREAATAALAQYNELTVKQGVSRLQRISVGRLLIIAARRT
jgi:hypothetical protein